MNLKTMLSERSQAEKMMSYMIPVCKMRKRLNANDENQTCCLQVPGRKLTTRDSRAHAGVTEVFCNLIAVLVIQLYDFVK